ncbi:ankyrin repeat-containing domain protein [Annulohypoxylon moriforme]|nr:ankyrin repeat-containing domain protein [Annulohypoxylon moriforme]
MSPQDDNFRSHVNINAENKGAGSQYMLDGSGDQNVATASGMVYKINRQFNILELGEREAKGMPSLLHLFQSELLNREGNHPQGPNCGDIVSWLTRQPDQTPLNIHQHHNELLRQVSQGTGKWILDTEKFIAWKDASSPLRFLWMYGIVGSGKTILLSLIINSLEKEIESGNDVACVYFYFQEGEEHHVTFARIWATLLKQLLRASKNLAGELKVKFDESLQGSTQLGASEYLELFKAQASTVKTVYLIIDAMDNCRNIEEGTHGRMQDALKSLPDNIRILYTSRNESFRLWLGETSKLSITPKQQDVELYVEKRIEDSELLRDPLRSEQVRNEVIREVTEMTLTSGMFLLARIQMDNLSKQGTLNDIKNALGQLPDSAFEIFDISAREIAQKINLESNGFKSSLAKHILTWVMHAKTGLTIKQIRDSFGIQKSNGQRPYQEFRPEQKYLMPLCNGLIVMDPENGMLNLVHKSVRGYLQKHKIIPENANLGIAKTCLSCLLIDTYGQEIDPSLLQYAAKYWWAHLGNEGQEVTSEAESLALEFLRDSRKLARAFKALEGTQNTAFDKMTGLHSAVHFNLLRWAKRLIKEKINVNAQCSDGQTAMHWAVRYGRCEILELLISKSADPNITDHAGDTPLHKALMGPTDDNTPLHQAIIRPTASDTDIAKVLIKGGARLDIKNAKGISPMLSAIRYGPTSIARIMVESQDSVDAEVFDGWTSLRQAFYHGQDMENNMASQGDRLAGTEGWAQLQHAVRSHARFLIDVLLERGVDLNQPSAVDGWTPLLHAARNGDLFKLSRLLTRQPNPANVHLQDKDGKPPLWWAISYKHAAVIQMLVEHGAKVDETYNDGSTPLLTAINLQDSETVQLLVRLGADVNKKIESGSTHLIEAIKSRDNDTVWVLLNAKAVLHECDVDGKSALFYAIKNKDKALAWLLIAKGGSAVSTNKSKNMQDALELALMNESRSMAWLLCEHGASPNVASDNYLDQAIEKGNRKIAEFLIERGVVVDAKDTGSTPLHYAVLRGQDGLTDLLASKTPRSSLDILDAKGNTALILATLKKQPAAMESLIRYGASCNVADRSGLTALHYTATLGFNMGLNVILNSKFDMSPNVVDNEHFTPLHHAVNGNRANQETVRMLVQAGANIEIEDKHGRTPLMLAAQLGNEELVRGLLIEGADAHARNEDGWTVISYAKKYPDIQRLLQAQSRRR